MVKMNVVKSWTFEREGPGRGPTIKEGDKIDCSVDFAKKLIRREVAEVADADARGNYESFPPPVEEQTSTKVNAQLAKLQEVTGGEDDAKSDGAQKSSDAGASSTKSPARSTK